VAQTPEQDARFRLKSKSDQATSRGDNGTITIHAALALRWKSTWGTAVGNFKVLSGSW
jgi:hypothetical protein